MPATVTSKTKIRSTLAAEFEYDLDRTVESIRPSYHFDVTCQGSVPEAIIAFLDSESYEEAVRNAVSLDDDSDTLACMARAIAEAFYREIPSEILRQIPTLLSKELWNYTMEFYQSHGIRRIKKHILN